MELLSGLSLALLACAAAVQDPAPSQPPAPESSWSFSGNAYYSDPPGSGGRLTPIVYADRGPLHLELRYNYEDLDTASLFAGWRFALDGELEFAATPMVGAVIGATDGIAPGLELDLGWKRLAWYAEAEYVFDLEDSRDDFFYSWSTLTYALTDALRVGVVGERNKLVDTDLSMQRGLALELSYAQVSMSLYAYNLGSDDAYSVVALTFTR